MISLPVAIGAVIVAYILGMGSFVMFDAMIEQHVADKAQRK